MSWLCTENYIVLAENMTGKCIHKEEELEGEGTPTDITTTILYAYIVQEIHVKCFNTFLFVIFRS